MRFTDEQRVAIERRRGSLLLDAGAGSGKTSVLVERFVRAVLEDGVEVGAILTITFTEKAAAELRERIRARLVELGAAEAARATEGAYISTIHAFCARVLRAHALTAGVDPAFAVLEPVDAAELSGVAFDAALAVVAAGRDGAELLATHGPAPLRAAIVAVHDELRSRGQREPRLPPAPPGAVALAAVRERAVAAARAAAAELGAIAEPSVRVTQALGALERARDVLGGEALWPGELDAIGLPARNGATALRSDACDEYREAVQALRAAAAAGFAARARDVLDRLLGEFARRYAAEKAQRSALDFEDLELLARDLLARPEIGSRYRQRFAHVMVDELQDTNRVQLELIDLVAGGNLFMVGDAQQSIYGFRHAEVELFEERGRELEQLGARASLQTNFRSRPEILTVLNGAFAIALGERFRPLAAGRTEPPAGEPLVELQVIDKGADWDDDGLAAPWRLAEARALARRVRTLIDAGEAAAGDVVVLTRATTDLRAYERALEDAGVATYVIGGRGYWGHPQVVELVAYLRALANPLDDEAWWSTLVSPLCGLSLDGLVLVAAGARDELAAGDAARLERFETWFQGERRAAARLGVEALLDRALAQTGYDVAVVGMPGGRRRLANVRKLMRLGREFEAKAGPDLSGFLAYVEQRTWGATARDSEAPVESEGLDAVRLMTIHRAKGLEFPVCCVADLGRGPMYRHPLIRVSGDGRRLGLRIGRPGSGGLINALDYEVLRDEAVEAEQAEERRLFYVAMTRARERLILSGAGKPESWEKGNQGTPVDWIVPAFKDQPGVRFTFLSEGGGQIVAPSEPKSARRCAEPAALAELEAPAAIERAAIASLSYSSLSEYARCGYRFYAERVLRLPPTPVESAGAVQRGIEVHAALQELDFERPVVPAEGEVGELVRAFLDSPLRTRLKAATHIRREQAFAFPLDDLLVTGTFDVLATDDERALVVDYKTDRDVRPYDLQQVVYALAALRAGHPEVEVVHLFLVDPARPVLGRFTADDMPRLEATLRERAAGLRAGRFEVTDTPFRAICAGCPAAGGLCSWPVEVAMRPAPDRLC